MMRAAFLTAALVAVSLVAGCQPKSPEARLEDQAEQFVKLGLWLGKTHSSEVDAYFGPPKLDVRDDKDAPPPAELLTRARALQAELDKDAGTSDSARRQALSGKVQYFIALLESITATSRVPFEEEARRLYGVTLPVQDEAVAKAKLKELGELLPGPGSVAFRVASYRNRFIVPGDKRQVLFERALEECRRRTAQHWKLPDNEKLKVEWTRDVDAAWHRYEGKGQGSLRINPAAVAYMGTALDLACHEGYPGHQAQFLLHEAAAGAQGLPVEDTMILLRTPASVLREGAANFAADLAFPAEERLVFERDVLFPLAGMKGADAEKYLVVHRLINELALSALPILRDYRNSVISFNSATFKLESDALIASPASLLKFTDEYGAYVVGYTVARDQVRSYVEKTAQQSGEDTWTVLGRLLTQLDASALSSPTG